MWDDLFYLYALKIEVWVYYANGLANIRTLTSARKQSTIGSQNIKALSAIELF